ncbi:MAG TPA: hypothetical protein VOA87_05205, partial [Thermoanaerobaculia bacterium]|nr:hypothetical protein [Thermoanaerobaculia bacterium]
NGDRSWHGYSMAYLMGSAYLEWLEGRAGRGSLTRLWARLSARRSRSFDDAFSGVFGDGPADLYARFTAELTARALEAEKRIAPVERAGSVWQRLARDTGAPALSPDGKEIAVVLRDPHRRDRPAELVVWSTGPADDEEKRWQKERERIAARDPEDVPAVRSRPLPRKPLHRLPSIDGVEPTTPRFLPDGKSILFVRFEPDGQGFLHPDLFRWETAGGRIERLTWQADLRDPDPAPQGNWAVAVRDRDGFSQVVRVDLGSGAVEALTEPTVEIIYDHPRISPDGGRIAFARHREGAWELVVRDLATGAEAIRPSPADAIVASPAWSADGRTLYAVLGWGGFVDVDAFAAGGGEPGVAVTLTQGGALAPAPTPDGKGLFYLGLEADGLDLYRLDLPAKPLPAASLPAMTELAPAARPAPPATPPPFARAEPPPGRDERFGRQEVLALASGQVSSAGGALEVGARGGDLLGRLDYLALGSLAGAGGPRGAALAATWRGWPVALSFHLFDLTEHPAQQSGRVPEAAGALDRRQRGVEARARWRRRLGPAELSLSAGGLRSHGSDHSLAFLDALYGGRRSRGLWWSDEEARAHWEHGRTDGDSWDRYGGTLALGVGHGEDGIVLSYRRDGSAGTLRPGDRFELGGSPSSILPESALAGRILVPALPLGTMLGAEHEAERAEIQLGFLPAPLFYERHRLWSAGEKGDWLALTGLEWRFALGPQPIARLPAVDLRLGVARVLDPPFKGDTRWWLVTVLRP